MTALQPREAGLFWQWLGPAIDSSFGRPKAIVVASAHSLARGPVLLAAERHAAVYDFGGFDPALHKLRYDAPGAPLLAARVQALLGAAGIGAGLSPEGGLDHGIWVPLRWAWPDAHVPVLPLAWPVHASAAELLALGRALAPLAAEGVLVLGSGSITHNLQRAFANGWGQTAIDAPATEDSTAFREWFASRTAAGDVAALLAWEQQAPHAALMHPSTEHLLPWFVAAGAGGLAPTTPGHRIHASLTFAELGMDAYAFGPSASRLATIAASF